MRLVSALTSPMAPVRHAVVTHRCRPPRCALWLPPIGVAQRLRVAGHVARSRTGGRAVPRVRPSGASPRDTPATSHLAARKARPVMHRRRTIRVRTHLAPRPIPSRHLTQSGCRIRRTRGTPSTCTTHSLVLPLSSPPHGPAAACVTSSRRNRTANPSHASVARSPVVGVAAAAASRDSTHSRRSRR